jgi:hypothetical protein
MSGRGRGRGRAPPSGARLLLQRSAQEAGLDALSLRGLQDITKPLLFPDFEWHSSGRIGHAQDATPAVASQQAVQSKRAKESMIYLINKGREIQHSFQESPFYVKPSQEVDVIRYNKRPRPLEADAHVVAYMGKTADSRYIPTELLPDKAPKISLNKDGDGEDALPKRVLTLEELAAEERKKKAAGEEGEDEGELSDTQDLDEEDEEEIADYTQDYYASDDESDGGGGGGDEAVF